MYTLCAYTHTHTHTQEKPALTELYLSENNIRNKGVRYLADALVYVLVLVLLLLL